MSRRYVWGTLLVLLGALAVPEPARAGAVLSGSVRMTNAAYIAGPCAANECTAFMATGCTENSLVQENRDDTELTSGVQISIVAVPPNLRGKIGDIEWKITGPSAAADVLWTAFLSDDCKPFGTANIFVPTALTIPGNAAWMLAFKTPTSVAREFPYWWQWRER